MRPTPAWLAACLLLSAACSGSQSPHWTPGTAGFAMPMPVGEGNTGKKAASKSKAPPAGSASAAASAAAAPSPAASGAAAPPSAASVKPGAHPAVQPSAQPDPEALRTAEQAEYTLIYENGGVRIETVRRLRFERPVVTSRKMGRFAVELWVGRELIERVRFDFPMLAAEEPPTPGRHRLVEPPPLTKGPLRATILVPVSQRARKAVLLDRGTGKETDLEWPPVATPAASASAAAETRPSGP